MSETENTKAVILTQADGQKIFLDLNMSTDITAIKSFEKGAELSVASFDYATGIAVFLALCATGLAYWYGQRSFKLTEMSFKTVMNQIKSSEKSALDLNKKMFQQQLELQINQQKYNQRNEIVRTFRDSSSIFIIEAENCILNIVFLEQKHKNYVFMENIEPNTYQDVFFNKITQELELLSRAKSKITFYCIEVSKLDYEDLQELLVNVYISILDVRNSLIRDRVNFNDYLGISRIKIEEAKIELSKIAKKS